MDLYKYAHCDCHMENDNPLWASAHDVFEYWAIAIHDNKLHEEDLYDEKPKSF